MKITKKNIQNSKKRSSKRNKINTTKTHTKKKKKLTLKKQNGGVYNEIEFNKEITSADAGIKIYNENDNEQYKNYLLDKFSLSYDIGIGKGSDLKHTFEEGKIKQQIINKINQKKFTERFQHN